MPTMIFKGKAVMLLVLNFLLTYLPFIDHVRVGSSFTDAKDRKGYDVFFRECLLTPSQCPPQSMSLTVRKSILGHWKSCRQGLLVKRKLTVSSMVG